MLHTKFQEMILEKILKVLTIYGHGGHLNVVIYDYDQDNLYKFLSPLPLEAQHKICCKIGQVQHRNNIDIHFLDLKSLILHAKFQDFRIASFRENIF